MKAIVNPQINNNTNTTNKRPCVCKRCGQLIASGEGLKVYAQNGFGYMHQYCACTMEGGYCDENGRTLNAQTKTNKNTYSIELEIPHEATAYQSSEAFGWLKNEGFIKTPDCTVWAEFKSPIYNNLLGLTRTLRNFEKLNKLALWNDNPAYGTHCNVGNLDLTSEKIGIVRRFYNSLFVGYSDFLANNPEKCRKVYGRDLSGQWARPISMYTDWSTHENFINLQHDTHIEFRAAKLITANQYIKCARLNGEIVQKCIVDYFLKRYREEMPAKQKREIAQKASQKMIKLFNKYYDMLANEE